MPRSTFSAVRTPGSDRPSSTSVIATAGLHADDDRLGVEHARHRGDVGEHPADERVDDLEREMSISTPRAPVSTIRCGEVVLQRIAMRSCMSTWIVTSSRSPILRIGMRSTVVAHR